MNLKGKSALITGAGSGMGRAMAHLFAQRGAGIVICDKDLSSAEMVKGQVSGLGARAIAIQADVSNPEQVNAMVKAAFNEFPRIDILVNNAGIGSDLVPFRRMTYEQWDRMIAVHLYGTFNCTRGVIEKMIAQKQGRVINMSSVNGLMGETLAVHYSAAKAAIIGFTKALAKEVAHHGITVNAIAPGVIGTPMIDKLGAQVVDSLIKTIPVGRKGKPEEIAHLAAFLASDHASYITGQVISPNGGSYM